MNLIDKVEIRKGIDRLYRTWAEIHLSILDNWEKKNWKTYHKKKNSYFQFPFKWTIIATGKTEEEAERNAKDIISRYRDR